MEFTQTATTKTGRPSYPTRVFEFRCSAPINGIDIFADVMRNKNELWNKLVAIHEDNHTRYRQLVATKYDADINPLLAQIKELKQQLRQKKGQAAFTTIQIGNAKAAAEHALKAAWRLIRGKEEISPVIARHKYKAIPKLLYDDYLTVSTLRKAVAELVADLQPLIDKQKAAREKMKIKNATQIEQLQEEHDRLVKEAVQSSRLHWTNSETVSESYRQARAKAFTNGTSLNFKPWLGFGKVSVRYKDGRDRSTLFQPNPLFQLEPIAAEAWESESRPCKKKRITTARIQLERNQESGACQYVEFKMLMHRPLPEQCQIRSVSYIRKKIGNRFQYKATIVVRVPQPKLASLRKPTVHVHLGWELRQDKSLLVARWVDSRGRQGELVLPTWTTSRFEKVDWLRSEWKKYMNQAADAIGQMDKRKHPAWFKEETKALHSWKKPGLFLHLFDLWQSQRFSGDTEAFAQLEMFEERFQHLKSWEVNLLNHIQLRRREVYRIFAKEMATTYWQIGMSGTNLLEKDEKLGDGQKATNIRTWARTANLSSLKTAILHTASREGVTVTLDDAPEEPLAKGKAIHQKRLADKTPTNTKPFPLFRARRSEKVV